MATKKREAKKVHGRRSSQITSTAEVSRPISIRETPRQKFLTRDDFMAALIRVSKPQPGAEA